VLFETVFCEYQKLYREIKQARLVNIVLDAAKTRTHELKTAVSKYSLLVSNVDQKICYIGGGTGGATWA